MTVILLALALVVSQPGVAGAPTLAGKDKARKSKSEPYALLFGTVFDESGRLVRGAQVQVRQRQGKGHWEAQTDSQGEFAVHLPVGKAVYTIEARAPALLPDRKEVEFAADERVDVVLHLRRP